MSHKRRYWLVEKTGKPEEEKSFRDASERDGFFGVATWLRWLGINRAKRTIKSEVKNGSDRAEKLY